MKSESIPLSPSVAGTSPPHAADLHHAANDTSAKSPERMQIDPPATRTSCNPREIAEALFVPNRVLLRYPTAEQRAKGLPVVKEPTAEESAWTDEMNTFIRKVGIELAIHPGLSPTRRLGRALIRAPQWSRFVIIPEQAFLTTDAHTRPKKVRVPPEMVGDQLEPNLYHRTPEEWGLLDIAPPGYREEQDQLFAAAPRHVVTCEEQLANNEVGERNTASLNAFVAKPKPAGNKKITAYNMGERDIAIELNPDGRFDNWPMTETQHQLLAWSIYHRGQKRFDEELLRLHSAVHRVQ